MRISAEQTERGRGRERAGGGRSALQCVCVRVFSVGCGEDGETRWPSPRPTVSCTMRCTGVAAAQRRRRPAGRATCTRAMAATGRRAVLSQFDAEVSDDDAHEETRALMHTQVHALLSLTSFALLPFESIRGCDSGVRAAEARGPGEAAAQGEFGAAAVGPRHGPDALRGRRAEGRRRGPR